MPVQEFMPSTFCLASGLDQSIFDQVQLSLSNIMYTDTTYEQIQNEFIKI